MTTYLLAPPQPGILLIRAPFAGVVDQVLVPVGAWCRWGAELLSLTDSEGVAMGITLSGQGNYQRGRVVAVADAGNVVEEGETVAWIQPARPRRSERPTRRPAPLAVVPAPPPPPPPPPVLGPRTYRLAGERQPSAHRVDRATDELLTALAAACHLSRADMLALALDVYSRLSQAVREQAVGEWQAFTACKQPAVNAPPPGPDAARDALSSLSEGPGERAQARGAA